jgi:hypothetical protein
MTARSARRAAFVGGLVLAALLPLLARALGPSRAGRCALDGRGVEGRHLVTVEESDGTVRRFCGVGCAEEWIRRAKPVSATVQVTDEATGERLPAETAWYVRSTVAVNAPRDDRIHVFARREDAERHAAAFHGTLLVGPDRPFAPPEPGR